ncbi:MAG: hypothetical protein JXA66_05750 [Oligoflexia bacterium]|nr:hypothetical protein [Oligoflexia bacterium]
MNKYFNFTLLTIFLTVAVFSCGTETGDKEYNVSVSMDSLQIPNTIISNLRMYPINGLVEGSGKFPIERINGFPLLSAPDGIPGEEFISEIEPGFYKKFIVLGFSPFLNTSDGFFAEIYYGRWPQAAEGDINDIQPEEFPVNEGELFFIPEPIPVYAAPFGMKMRTGTCDTGMLGPEYYPRFGCINFNGLYDETPKSHVRIIPLISPEWGKIEFDAGNLPNNCNNQCCVTGLIHDSRIRVIIDKFQGGETFIINCEITREFMNQQAINHNCVIFDTYVTNTEGTFTLNGPIKQFCTIVRK